MRLQMLAVVMTTSLAAPPTASANYFHTAADVAQVCSIEEAALVCSAYLGGVADAVFSNRGELGGNKICMPEQVTREQIKSAFIGFLQKHPDFNKAIGASVIAAALSEAFPCDTP